MPRAGLNRERIAAQAAVVVDEMGFDRLTLAAVAARCGVSLPGLYKHVDGLEAVKRDVAVQSVREITAALASAAAGLAGRDALHGHRHRVPYVRHRPSGPVRGQRARSDPGGRRVHGGQRCGGGRAGLGAEGYQIEGDDMIDAVRMMRAALHGFVSIEMAGGFGLHQSVDATFARLVDTLDSAWSTWGK